MACQMLIITHSTECIFTKSFFEAPARMERKVAISMKIIIRTLLRCTRASDSHKFSWLLVVRGVNDVREVQVIIIAYTSTSLNYRT
jgi:hypothetical protein